MADRKTVLRAKTMDPSGRISRECQLHLILLSQAGLAQSDRPKHWRASLRASVSSDRSAQAL